jgi:hypothetical protein
VILCDRRLADAASTSAQVSDYEQMQVSDYHLFIIHAICKNNLTESLVQCIQNNVYNLAPDVDPRLSSTAAGPTASAASISRAAPYAN